VRRIPLDNKINFSVRNLADAGIGASFGGLLSSREKGKSMEAPERDLPGDNAAAPPDSGYGLFSYYLVQALQAPSKILAAPPREPGAFVEFLGAHVGQLSRKLDEREQRPSAVGKLGVIPADWDKPGTQVRNTAMGPRFPVFPGLIAFNGRFLPGIAAQAAAAAPGPLQRFVAAMHDANLHGPAGVGELLASLKAQGPDSLGAAGREVFAAAVEDAGQQIVARYGTGDQFPDDPRKLKKRDFELAAALFTEARDLRLREAKGAVPRRFCVDERLELTLPDDPEALALEARRLFSLGRAALSSGDDTVMRPASLDRRDLEEAERRLRCAVALDGSMPEARNALGIAELLLAQFDDDPERRFEAAAVHFRQALRVTPNWAYPRHNLALVYAEQGRSSAAEKEIRGAIERTPYYPYLYYNLGLTLQRTNKLDEAERSYQNAIRVFDLEIRRYRERAASWTDLPSRAALARDVADALERNQVEAFNALASLQFQRRNFARAEKNFALALQRDPAHAPARHNLALLYLQSGARDKAEDLLRANADFHLSRLELAEMLAAKGQAEEAGKLYDAVLASSPDNTEARLGLSAALSALGRTPEAAQVLSWPGGASQRAVQERLGDLHLKLGNTGEACAAFGRAMEADRRQFGGAQSGKRREELRRKLEICQTPAQ
jgi:tetratricopeptide (TPR) repeat protein